MINSVTINGKYYPCRLTVGTLKRFKDKTGKEIDALKDMFTICELLFMAVTETCNKQNKKFPYTSSDQMMDDIDISSIEQITSNLFGTDETAAVNEKKTDGRELTMSLVSQQV